MDEGLHEDRRPTLTPLVAWLLPLVSGVVLAIAAAGLGNPLIPIGTAEVLTAFVLGAVVRSSPFRTGVLLVVPIATYVLVARSDELPSWMSTVVLFVLFGLFNGLFAGAGASWAADIGRRRRRDRRPPTTEGTS